ncbi:hypothetical protein ACWGCW_28920, partial [Streptomyces sp. NPDC054933]
VCVSYTAPPPPAAPPPRPARPPPRAPAPPVADLVIDNDGPLEALEPQVRKVWEALRERVSRISRPNRP